jgi:cold shock CspA family protein
VVSRKGENMSALLVEAFDVLSLQLKEIQRKKRKDYKVLEGGVEVGSFGVVRKVSPFESYGFIVTPDGREIYFHENALKDIPLDQVTEGDEVMYGETIGDKGPQASWVRVSR